MDEDFLLFDNDPLTIDKNDLKELDFNEAIVLDGIKKMISYNGGFSIAMVANNELPFYCMDTTKRCIDSLKEKEVLKKKFTTDNYKEIKELMLSNLNNGGYKCEWCGNKTNIIHEHHYPVPKRLGGTDTVSICPNCHYEFHFYEHTYELNK